MNIETDAEHPGSDVPRITRTGRTLNAMINAAATIAYFGVTFLLVPIAAKRFGPGGWCHGQIYGATSAYALQREFCLGEHQAFGLGPAIPRAMPMGGNA